MLLSEQDLSLALEALKEGDVIGLPTETVYGLAADATNPDAVRKIFAIKGRPADHPLILHLGDASWLERYTVEAPPSAHILAKKFWPGPLSLVLRRAGTVPDEVTGGLGTVAVRVPAHPIALEVMLAFGRPLAAPSANRFGEVSPTSHAHVVRDFGAQVPVVLDGGSCDVGVESTIVDLTGALPRILRPGGISAGQIEAALGVTLGQVDGTAPAAPGTLDAHYAPRAEVRLTAEAALWDEVRAKLDQGVRVGVFTPGAPPPELASRVEYRPMGDATAAAHALYAVLRSLDDAACDVVFATHPDEAGIGSAVVDRLKRAAVGSRR